MTTYRTKLVARAEVADRTLAFHFERPAGFHFKAGQAIELVLPDSHATDAAAARHTFSLASAPFEGDLVVATRMRDTAFKRTLGALPIGSAAVLDGPFGSLTLPQDRSRAGMAAPLFYVAGPPTMVDAMQQTLQRMGVDDADVRTEGFYGY